VSSPILNEDLILNKELPGAIVANHLVRLEPQRTQKSVAVQGIADVIFY